jgi:glutamate--cysteine ligase
MRGADAGSRASIPALPAFWVGLLYDAGALDAASRLVADWTAEERQGLRDTAPRLGLATPFRGRTLRDVAAEVLAIARSGLKARARLDDAGRDETVHLEMLDEIVASGETQADRLLAAWHGEWSGDIDRVLEATAW